jgi:hypothetical protein
MGLWRSFLRIALLSGVPRSIGLLDGKIYARPVHKGGIMRKILIFMVAALALLQAWSVIGQETQESLSLGSEVEAPAALEDFLNDTSNDTVNDTVNDTLIDTNLTATASQSDFLDMPVNDTLIDTNLTATASQSAFLDQPVNDSLIDTSLDITSSMMEFLTGEPVAAETSFYTKGKMMGT